MSLTKCAIFICKTDLICHAIVSIVNPELPSYNSNNYVKIWTKLLPQSESKDVYGRVSPIATMHDWNSDCNQEAFRCIVCSNEFCIGKLKYHH